MNLVHKLEGINAVKWALLDRFGSQLVLLINTIVLARLLSPKDFGLISILYIFISISGAFVDSGMGGGLIRKQDLTDTDCCTFFFFNISVAVTFYLILFFLAPYVAEFYKQPLIVMLLRILGITVIINSLGLIQKVLLIKNLKFKYVTRSSLMGSFISTIIALTCAWHGMGVWSLLILQVSQASLNMIFLWTFSRWYPHFIFSMDSLRELYAFGLGLFLTGIVNLIFANIYQPLIGKYFSVTYSGFFYQAKRLYEVPVLTISSVVDSVTYPILVKYQADRAELSNNYIKIVKLLVFVAVPIVVAIALLSDNIVLVLLGKKWLFSGELLRILSFAGIFLILETINGSLLKIEGRTKLIFKLELIKKAIMIINIIIFCQFGLKALVYGIVINSIISFALNQYFTSIKFGNYQTLLKLLLNGAIMGAIVFYLSALVHNPYFALCLAGLSGFFAYLLLGYLLKLQEQKWLFMIITNKLKTSV